MKKTLWALYISIIIVALSAIGYFVYSILSDPVFYHAIEETQVDSKVPLAERIEKWSKVLDEEAEKVSRLNIPAANAHMAELCNSTGFTLADECHSRKFGRNYILVAIWMFRNAAIYADEPPVTERSVDARKFATSAIKGLTNDYNLSESELRQVEVRLEKSLDVK